MTKKTLTNYCFSLSCLLIILTTFSCNGEKKDADNVKTDSITNKNENKIDSVLVVNDYLKNHPTKNSDTSIISFTRGLTRTDKSGFDSEEFPNMDMARDWAKNYKLKPITALTFEGEEQTPNGNRIRRRYIQSLEFDNNVIKYIRNHNNVNGIRVYLAKKTLNGTNDYTVIAVPYNADGSNETKAFDWHKPCPPNCTGNNIDAVNFAGGEISIISERMP